MLISTADCATHLDDPRWVIFDCRHDLSNHARGAELYAAGHVPGARFADVERDLSGPKTGRNGRHPLPTPSAFAAFLARAGVTPETTIVAYDDAGGLYAARLWWMARWIGLSRVALLDGGLTQWKAEGRPLETARPTPVPGQVEPREQAGLVWTAADVQARLGRADSALIDARTPERFRGESEPIDAVAGHIPGALNRPYRQNLRPDSTFRPPAELRQEFQTLLGTRAPAEVGHQCGSGITACANLFAMELAGLKGSKLYPGSWSEWIADPSRPVAKGAERPVT